MHGSYGSPEENWFRWLEHELKGIDQSVVLEQFPVDNWNTISSLGADNISSYKPIQSLSSWDKYFQNNILPKIQNEPTIFIGHSVTPIFILHMLQKYNFKLAGAIFVSPFFNIPDRAPIWQFYPVNHTFYNYDFDFRKIANKLGKSYVVHSDNDPYVPASEPPLFAKKLGSKLVMIPGGGHCGSEFKSFPLILDLAKKFLS